MAPWRLQGISVDRFPDLYPAYESTARLLADMGLPPDFEMRSTSLRGQLKAGRQLWVAGSTHAGEEIIALERSSLIGAGIMGMALIFALSWIYHRYIRITHD